MKKIVLILMTVLVSSFGVLSASPNNQSLETFSSNAQLGDTALHFASSNSRVLIATVEQGDLTLNIIGRLGGYGRGRINFIASRSNGDVETGFLFLGDAETGDFSALIPVAEVVGQDALRGIAGIALDLADSGMVAAYQAHYLVAAMSALASSEGQSYVKAAWPWDYAAYSVCYYSAVTGCLAGGGSSGYCWTSAENQCSHYVD